MQLVCGSDNALTGGILSCGHLYRSKPLRLSAVHLRLWHKGVVVIVLCTLSYPDSYNKVTGGSLEACTLTRILSCTVQLPHCTAKCGAYRIQKEVRKLLAVECLA